MLKIDEWAIVLRKHCGISQAEVSDDDMEGLFRIMDVNNSGQVSVKEFAAFYRGASVSVQARGLAHETKQSKQRRATKAEKKKAEVFKVSSAYTKLRAAQTLQDEIAAARADLAGSLLALASPRS